MVTVRRITVYENRRDQRARRALSESDDGCFSPTCLRWVCVCPCHVSSQVGYEAYIYTLCSRSAAMRIDRILLPLRYTSSLAAHGRAPESHAVPPRLLPPIIRCHAAAAGAREERCTRYAVRGGGIPSLITERPARVTVLLREQSPEVVTAVPPDTSASAVHGGFPVSGGSAIHLRRSRRSHLR
jgi:hypothetical protein